MRASERLCIQKKNLVHIETWHQGSRISAVSRPRRPLCELVRRGPPAAVPSLPPPLSITEGTRCVAQLPALPFPPEPSSSAPPRISLPPPAMGDAARGPPVAIRPFRAHPPAAAAADAASVVALFTDGMAAVKADLPAVPAMDADAVRRLADDVDAFVAATLAGDLDAIPTRYALRGGAEHGRSDTEPPRPPSAARRGYFFLAVDAATGAPLGCVGGKPSRPPAPPAATGGGATPPPAPPPPPAVELMRMAVAPAARRRGVGRSLVRALEAAAAADGVGRVHLATLSSMVPAVRLYEACGYRVAARVPLAALPPPDTLDVPVDEVTMERWLGGGGGEGVT